MTIASTPKPDQRRVAVALSGGVDSAVVAALLKQQGHDVFGLTMLLQPGDSPEDARRVAQQIGIEHHTVDLTELFHSRIMEPFAESYLRGETPLPCARCNRLVKLGALMDVAKEHGASAMATGHYARRVVRDGRASLHCGVDPIKDQSYFLFALSQAQIDFLLLPLGDIKKEDTRRIAEEMHLPVAKKKDSQDICFVSCGDYVSVLQKLKPDSIQPGDIIDETGRVLGQHKGIVYFTVGQRKGLNLSDRVGDNNEPLFVLRLIPDKRQIMVGPREALAQQRVRLTDMNWLGDNVPADGLRVSVKLRSSQKPVSAMLFMSADMSGHEAMLQLDEPAYGVAPGQAGVIYLEGRLLGGGWIALSD